MNADIEARSQIRLIAGLGNPGPEYAATRHNIGFLVVDKLAAQFGSTWEKSGKWDALSTKCGAVLLVRPLAFMNRSGYPLLAVAQFYKAQFGTEEIPRLRIGIGAAPTEGSVDYVLSRFFDEEKPIVRASIDRAVEALKCAIDNGLVSAMNTFNKSEEI